MSRQQSEYIKETARNIERVSNAFEQVDKFSTMEYNTLKVTLKTEIERMRELMDEVEEEFLTQSGKGE